MPPQFWAETPTPVPLPRYTVADIHPVIGAISATTARYAESAPGRARGDDERRQYLKILWARYFSLLPKDMEVILGIEAATEDEGLRPTDKITRDITNAWRRFRSEAFGPSSYLDKISEHTVLVHDFKATAWNMAREIRIKEQPVDGETPIELNRRNHEIAQLRTAFDEHLHRWRKALRDRLTEAQTSLQLATSWNTHSGTRMTAKAQDDGKRIRDHRQSEHDEFNPWDPFLDSAFENGQIPPAQLPYCAKPIEDQQTLWDEVYDSKKLEFGVNILWPAKDRIAIFATLEDPDYDTWFRIVVKTMCHDVWRFSISRRWELARFKNMLKIDGIRGLEPVIEDQRKEYLYDDLEALRATADDLPGIDLIKVRPNARKAILERRRKAPTDDSEDFVMRRVERRAN